MAAYEAKVLFAGGVRCQTRSTVKLIGGTVNSAIAAVAARAVWEFANRTLTQQAAPSAAENAAAVRSELAVELAEISTTLTITSSQYTIPVLAPVASGAPTAPEIAEAVVAHQKTLTVKKFISLK